jgi:hypothetical protein
MGYFIYFVTLCLGLTIILERDSGRGSKNREKRYIICE